MHRGSGAFISRRGAVTSERAREKEKERKEKREREKKSKRKRKGGRRDNRNEECNGTFARSASIRKNESAPSPTPSA